MKVKKRSPEARREAKIETRRTVDALRLARRYGSLEAGEALRQIDGAWPPGLFEALKGPYDDPKALDVVLRFLEDDPYFFASGYLKEIALRRLGRWPLDPDDRCRIAEIVLRAVDGPTAREFRRQCLAARYADRSILIPGLLSRFDSPDPTLVWRATAAALGMLGRPWPSRYDGAEVIGRVVEATVARLRALTEAR